MYHYNVTESIRYHLGKWIKFCPASFFYWNLVT